MKRFIAMLLILCMFACCAIAETTTQDRIAHIEERLSCSYFAALLFDVGEETHAAAADLLYSSTITLLMEVHMQMASDAITSADILSAYNQLESYRDACIETLDSGYKGIAIFINQTYADRGKSTEGLNEYLMEPYKAYAETFAMLYDNMLDQYEAFTKSKTAEAFEDFKAVVTDLCVDVWQQSYGGRYPAFSYDFPWIAETSVRFASIKDKDAVALAMEYLQLITQ